MRHFFLSALVIACSAAPLSAQDLRESACVIGQGEISCGRVVATGDVVRRTGEINIESLVQALARPGVGGGGTSLNPSECEILGGTIKADASCPFGITCEAASGNRVCINEITSP